MHCCPRSLFYLLSGRRCRTIDLATALFSIAPILSRPFVGWLVDTQGRRLVLICGLAGVAFVPMGYFISAGISGHAVKARRIVRTDVRAGRCYTTLLHDGIRSSRGICHDLCRTPLSAQRRYLFHRHCRSWDVWW